MYSCVGISTRRELSPGYSIGSTFTTLRSRLFLKSKPASLSAMIWKLGVGFDVAVCVSLHTRRQPRQHSARGGEPSEPSEPRRGGGRGVGAHQL